MSQTETSAGEEAAGTGNTALLEPPKPQTPGLTAGEPPLSAEHRLEQRRRSERRRAARLRKRLMLWGILPAVVALVMAAKLISMSIIANTTVTSYAEGNYEAALNTSQQQKIINIIETWKAPYNTGTSYLQLGFQDEARTELESALPLAGPMDQCYIRANLAIAIERQGEAKLAAGDRAGAEALWQESLSVLEQASPMCQGASRESQEASYQRIREKIDPSSSEGEQGEQDGSEQTQQDLQQLQQQQQQNQNDRQEQEEQEQQNSDSTDRPW